MNAPVPGECYAARQPSQSFAIFLVLPQRHPPRPPTAQMIAAAGDQDSALHLVELLTGCQDRFSAEHLLFTHGFRSTPPRSTDY